MLVPAKMPNSRTVTAASLVFWMTTEKVRLAVAPDQERVPLTTLTYLTPDDHGVPRSMSAAVGVVSLLPKRTELLLTPVL